jgi:hypothetical protein
MVLESNGYGVKEGLPEACLRTGCSLQPPTHRARAHLCAMMLCGGFLVWRSIDFMLWYRILTLTNALLISAKGRDAYHRLVVLAACPDRACGKSDLPKEPGTLRSGTNRGAGPGGLRAPPFRVGWGTSDTIGHALGTGSVSPPNPGLV